MTPEDLQAALARKAHEAMLALADAQAARDRAARDLDETRATVDSCRRYGLSAAHITIVEELVETYEAARTAAMAAVDAAADRLAVAQHATTEVGARHLELQATGAAGEFYQGVAGQTVSPAAPATGRPTTNDPLKVGERILLRDGEQFVGSASTKDDNGGLALGAAVDTPAGRQVHLGLPIDPDEKKSWRGGNAPTSEEEYDGDDDETYTIDTHADVTVVLDAADAARLPAEIERVIAEATAADKEYKLLAKECDRLYDQRTRLESQRFPGRGEEKISRDWQVNHEQKLQDRRRREYEQVADRLSPQDRAVYDERQQQINAAGKDSWEPGKEAEAAEVCGLTRAEFAELTEIDRRADGHLSRAESDRLDQLKYGGGNSLHPILPPLLAQQAALVCGLTLDEYRELERLEAIPSPNRIASYLRHQYRTRTDAEQARLDQLYAATGGVTGANQRETEKLRNKYRTWLECHHSSKWRMAQIRAEAAGLEATAQPLDPATAAELERVTAAYDAVGEKLEARGGYPSATVEIPARNGGSLVIEAMQQEEDGGVRYLVERKPADADENWSPGSAMDPYTPTPAQLRRLGKVAQDLATVKAA